ncbi:MAG TPA: helix-turn-helix domain-containing protein [Gemmatimonadaceae bacterium]|nr:helix-turn-helix domain-containing protein [Gemmatimonadaceae bacterium]
MAAGARELRWERRPEERPRELLDAAFRVFAANGYRATRLEQVAEAAGVTKGTIYHYFRNKEELFLRAVEQRRQRNVLRFTAMFEGSDLPLTVRLRQAIRLAWREEMSDESSTLRLLFGEVSVEAPDVFRAWMKEGVLEGWRHLAADIRRGQATGEFRRDADADVAARTFISSLLMEAQLRAHGIAELAPIARGVREQ